MLNGLRNDGIPGRIIVAGWVTQCLGPHATSIPVRRNNGQISFRASWPIGLMYRGQPVPALIVPSAPPAWRILYSPFLWTDYSQHENPRSCLSCYTLNGNSLLVVKQRVLPGHNPCGENVKLVSQLLVMTQLAVAGRDLKNALLSLKKNL